MKQIGELLPAAQPHKEKAALKGSGRAGTAVAVRAPEGAVLARPTPLPKLSPRLQRLVAIEESPPPAAVAICDDRGAVVAYEPPARTAPAMIEAAEAAEAASVADNLRTLLAERASPRTIREWFYRIVRGTARVRTAEEGQGYVAALMLAMSDYPALCFTEESERMGLLRFKFWPAVAEIAALCDEVAKPYRDRLALLDRVAARGVRPADWQPAWERAPMQPRVRTAEALAAVQAAAAAFRAEVDAREALVNSAPGPIHSPRAQLIRSYEQMVAAGGPTAGAAAVRLKQLRESAAATSA